MGERIFEQAMKKAQSKGGLFSFLTPPGQRYEEASELFKEAANQLVCGRWTHSPDLSLALCRRTEAAY